MSPKRYSSLGHQFDLRRLTRFVEVFAYFSPAHAYSLHVSFLGLFPILMSSNEALKQEAVGKLEGGGLFALAVSEKAHASELPEITAIATPATSRVCSRRQNRRRRPISSRPSISHGHTK